jgi:hypothetical protein
MEIETPFLLQKENVVKLGVKALNRIKRKSFDRQA